jgi:hypothetical protein
MQVFNLVNCRKLKNKEVNVFRGFFNNPMFLALLVFITVAQFLIVEYGNGPANCTPLSLRQHLFCIGLGASALAFGVLFRLVPLDIFQRCRSFNRKDERIVKIDGLPEYDQLDDNF